MKLTQEALERRRTEKLAEAMIALSVEGRYMRLRKPPTDEELDAIADACNEILNGIDGWLDDREDARCGCKPIGVAHLTQGSPRKRSKAVKKRTRKPSKKGARR